MWKSQLHRKKGLKKELSKNRERTEDFLRSQTTQREAALTEVRLELAHPEETKLTSRTMKMVSDLAFTLDDMHRDLDQDW
jgi:hypothetical protein